MFVAQIGFFFAWGCFAAFGALFMLSLLSYGIFYRVFIGRCCDGEVKGSRIQDPGSSGKGQVE
jgi:hypothetical protein